MGDGDVEDPPVVDGVDDDDDAGEGELRRGDFVGYVGKFSVKAIVRVSV